MDIAITQFYETTPVFHLKTSQDNKVRFVPEKLYKRYLKRRELFIADSRELELYFNTVKDKPMHVAKNHVKEGEIHRFNDDGSVTVIGSE